MRETRRRSLVLTVAAGLWWLARRTPRVVGPAGVAVAWAAYVWFTGRSWRHGTRRRVVRREVRAAGNWLITAMVAAVVWRPVATGVVLAVLGGSLVGTAVVTRRRQPTGPARGGPIRVTAQVGASRHLTRERR